MVLLILQANIRVYLRSSVDKNSASLEPLQQKQKKPAPESSRMPVFYISTTKPLLLLFHISNCGCQFILGFLRLELLP
jgi:hypothetical protein